jgi:hypothetical protein
MVRLTKGLCDSVIERIAQGWTNGAIAKETGLFRGQVKIIRSRNPGLRADRIREEREALRSAIVSKECEYFRQTTREGCERVGEEWDVLREKLHLILYPG